MVNNPSNNVPTQEEQTSKCEKKECEEESKIQNENEHSYEQTKFGDLINVVTPLTLASERKPSDDDNVCDVSI